MKDISTPLKQEDVRMLKAGDQVRLSGTVYTSRDAGHSRMIDMLAKGESLPFDVQDAIIYYVGPTPAKPGEVIGSAGPTTSYRMDSFTPTLIKEGLAGMIGKGDRSEAVIAAMKTYGAVYFAAVGGAAALIANSIEEAEVLAFEDLGTEALRKLKVKDFPCIVVIDSDGNNLYKSEKNNYRTYVDER